jgi:GNAT superfamily N-acetyltransferase
MRNRRVGTIAPVPRHLAQLNVARLRWPVGDERVADFVNALPEVNGLGEQAPGFVWRLQSDSGNATDIRAFDDPLMIVNLTVWDSLESLRTFAYRGMHRDFFRRRGEWFEPGTSRTALWWVDARVLPTVGDVTGRLGFIDLFGTSPYAFEMGHHQPALVVHRVELADERAQWLIHELNAELTQMYPAPGSTHFRLDHHEVDGERGVLLIAEVDDQPMACGAYRRLDDATAELKRMYVAPSARGTKLGAAVLAELEQAARLAGVRRLVLETGPLQTAARALYEKFGFRSCPCWGEYADAPASL